VAKVAKGCKKGAEAIVNKLKNNTKPIGVLTVNVFGFSRGAAAARHFIHVANSPGIISYALGKKRYRFFLPNSSIMKRLQLKIKMAPSRSSSCGTDISEPVFSRRILR
jgi:hypothetical protein